MSNRGRIEWACFFALFFGTRVVLHAAGFELNLDLRWMFLADPGSLRANWFETVLYFHAFPPGMNLLTAALLAVPPSFFYSAAACAFVAVGAALAAGLARMFQRVGLRRPVALSLALGFSLLPQSLYFEGLYLYTYPCAALLCWAAHFFYRAVEGRGTRHWVAFFSLCAALGWVRTTFHLVWFGAMLVLALWGAGSGNRRRVLVASIVPLVFLCGLYVKNWTLFGVFGTTSWSGANLTLTTTAQMPRAQREAWIREGRLSPLARLSVFASPKEYLAHVPSARQPYPWPGSNDLWRPETRQPNFNHGLFLEANRQRRRDALEFIRSEPWRYFTTVMTGNLPAFFSGSTHWHPHDDRPHSPHARHRQILGRYESVYDRIVHSFPTKGVGLYWLLPAAMVLLVRGARRDLQGSSHAKGALLIFCALQILYVVAVSSLLTAQESARYRFMVEPCIAVVVVVAIVELWQRGKAKWQFLPVGE